jgi:hypothetical protein
MIMSVGNLGKKARDVVTGFKGTITGYVQYLTGCNQYLLVPQVKEDGSTIDSCWYDDKRIEILDDAAIVLRNDAANGPDMEAPKR